MEIIKISILIILLATIVYIIYNIITKKGSIKKDENQLKEDKNNMTLADEYKSYFPSIQIVEDNNIVPLSKNKIENQKVKNALQKIDNIAPKSVSIKKGINNIKEISNNGRVFFSASAKEAEKMITAEKNIKRLEKEVAEAKKMSTKLKRIKALEKAKEFNKKNKGAVYGNIRQKNSNQFGGLVKFKKETELTGKLKQQELTNIGMNAASMVVGQYYMSEINDKLEKLSNEVNKISDFQDSEYQSKLLHILSKSKEILDNQDDILNNKETRKNAYNDLKETETKCSELLGQANTMINNKLNKEDLDYKKYTENVKDIEEWYVRQQITQELLMKIGDLRYTLANGNETYKLSHTQYNNYLSITNNINSKLNDWHNVYINKFGIDVEKQRKKGSLFKVREYTIGKINENWNYNKLENEILNEICYQTSNKKLELCNNEKKNNVIKIQKYNGEYYNISNIENE